VIDVREPYAMQTGCLITKKYQVLEDIGKMVKKNRQVAKIRSHMRNHQ
jgi:hypothetical protein